MFRKTALTTAALGVAAGFAIAAPAQAAPTGAHCIADLGSTTVKACFGTPAEAEKAISGMRGWIPMVKFFDGTGYAGKSITLGHSSARCDRPVNDGGDIHNSRMPAGWNDRVSSFVTRNNCDLKGYTDAGFRGTAFKKYQDHDIRLVKFNNKISSFRLS